MKKTYTYFCIIFILKFLTLESCEQPLSPSKSTRYKDIHPDDHMASIAALVCKASFLPRETSNLYLKSISHFVGKLTTLTQEPRTILKPFLQPKEDDFDYEYVQIDSPEKTIVIKDPYCMLGAAKPASSSDTKTKPHIICKEDDIVDDFLLIDEPSSFKKADSIPDIFCMLTYAHEATKSIEEEKKIALRKASTIKPTAIFITLREQQASLDRISTYHTKSHVKNVVTIPHLLTAAETALILNSPADRPDILYEIGIRPNMLPAQSCMKLAEPPFPDKTILLKASKETDDSNTSVIVKIWALDP